MPNISAQLAEAGLQANELTEPGQTITSKNPLPGTSTNNTTSLLLPSSPSTAHTPATSYASGQSINWTHLHSETVFRDPNSNHDANPGFRPPPRRASAGPGHDPPPCRDHPRHLEPDPQQH